MATTLSEFRKKYPQYDSVDDETLSRKLHEKYYSHVDYDTFASKFIDSAPPVEIQKTTATKPAEPIEPDETTPRADYADNLLLDEQKLTSTTPGGGFLALPEAPKSHTEETRQLGELQSRLIKIGERKPEDYGMTREEFDARTQELVAEEQKRKARRDQTQSERQKAIDEIYAGQPVVSSVAGGGPLGFPSTQDPDTTVQNRKPVESKTNRPWGKYIKTVASTYVPQIATGLELNAATTKRIDEQDLSVGLLYLDSLSKNMESRGANDKAKKLLDETAAEHGMTPDEYMQFTAEQVDLLVGKERGALNKYADLMKKVQDTSPITEDSTWLAKIASMTIENLPQIGYIGAGVALRNPAFTVGMMSTDVYARTYASARADGRTPQEAAQDAWFSAITESATEAIPVERFITLMRAGKKSKAMKLLEGLGTEGAQEGASELLQAAYDAGVLDMYDGMTVGAALGQIAGRVRDASVVGALMGSVVSIPVSMMSDDELADSRKKVSDTAKQLRSVAMRMQNPNESITKEEIDRAKADYTQAVQAHGKLVAEREEAAKEKKKKKLEKKEAKAVKKMTPKQKSRYEARKKQHAADQTLTGAPSEDDLLMADTMDKIAEGTAGEEDLPGLEKLLDAGYAMITADGQAAVLPAGQKRLQAVREAQANLEQPAAMEDEVIEPKPYTRPPETPVEGRNQKVEPKPYTTPENRRAALMERVDSKINDEEARGKIVDAIIKADEEAQMIEKREAELAVEQEKRRDKDYDKAVAQLRQEGLEEAEGLIAMDERSLSGYPGTQLGDVLRSAMAALEKREAKAREALSDAFWNKPVQGQLFDVTTVLAKGTKDYANLVTVGALKIAKVGLKYSAWSADMIGEFGDNIKPVLARVWHDAKKAVRDVMRISHEKFESGPRKGELKYSPKQYAKDKKIQNLRKVLERLAAEGEPGRYWYEKSGKAILKATGNVLSEARKFAGLLAIYSSGTAVGANTTNALKMWGMYQAGDLAMPKEGTKAGRFGEQDRTAIEWLLSDEDDVHFVQKFGDKRFPFFQNLMRAIDPKNYELGQGATIDLWMMRAFGYDTAAPTTAQFAFATTEIKNLAEKLGWENQQVQAAVWVAIKARWEFIQKEAKDAAVKKGWARWVKQKKGPDLFEVVGEEGVRMMNEKKIIGLFRKIALSKSIRTIEHKLNESKMDFADFMEKHYAVVSWEAEPSTSLGLNFNKLPLEAKLELQLEIARILTNPATGREYLAEWLGLLGQQQFVGIGAWDLNIGAVTQNQVIAPPEHKVSATAPTVEKNTTDALNGYVAILGYLLKQDATVWHRPFFGKAKIRSNGVEVPVKNINAKLVETLYVNIARIAEANGLNADWAIDNWAPVVIDGAIRVLNFTDVPNTDFHNLIEMALTATGIRGTMDVFQADGNMIQNDWVENPNGEQYVESINQNANPEVQKAFGRAKRQFGQAIAQAYQRTAARYQASGTGETVVVPAGKESAKPKRGYLRFRHFSKAKPHTISVNYFGTGIKGAERLRNNVQVISAYPDKGFKKEVGLGSNEYVIDVPEGRIYNADTDPLNLKALAMEPTTFDSDMNPTRFSLDWGQYEAAIREAGFEGYYRPNATGNMKGQARFFHDLNVRTDEAETAQADLRVGGPVRKITLSHPEDRATKIEAAGEFMDELYENTSHNPLTGGRVFDNKVSIDIESRNGEIWIDSIVAHTPGKGDGGRALGMILHAADKNGAVLNLFAEAFLGEDYGGLSQEDLENWYKDNGFAKVNGKHYVRYPQNPSIALQVAHKKRTNEGYGIPMWQGRAIVDDFKSQTGLDNIHLVESVEDLPEDIYWTVMSRGWANKLKGMFVPSPEGPNLYVIANSFFETDDLNHYGEPRPNKLRETLLHEAIGHYGTRAVLGARYNVIMDSIIRSMPKDVEYQRRLAHRDRSQLMMRLSAEEVIAHMANDELSGLDLSKVKTTILDRIVAEFRYFLIRMGWSEVTRDDILQLLFRASDFTRRNTKETLAKRANIADKMLRASEIMPMVAYHGSPHIFDAFDMSKIGTGEGLQAFGWGLYLAENPSTAKSYMLAGRPSYQGTRVAEKVNMAMKKTSNDKKAAKALLHKLSKTAIDKQLYYDAYNNFDEVLNAGHLYEINIPDKLQEQMLDWDGNIGGQPESVQSALQSVLDAIVQQTPEKHRAHQFAKNFPISKSKGKTGEEIYTTISSLMGGDQTASNMLLMAGIPGIKFLDQISRGHPAAHGGGFIKPAIQAIKGELPKSTRNLVLFSTDVIDSVKRDGNTVFSKRALAYRERADGAKEAYDPVSGQEWGLVLPTVPDEVLRASPGIQSWSRSGATNKPTDTMAPSLGSSRSSDPDLDSFLNKIGHHKNSKLTSLRNWWMERRGRMSKIFEIEILDQFAGIKHAEQMIGVSGGYMSVRLSAGADVVIRAAIEHGVPVWEADGTVKIDEGQKGLIEILAPIAQNPEMLKMFEAFIVARRAKNLHVQNRERLITKEEIAAVYRYVRKNKLYKLFNDTQKEFADYKKGILNFASDAGLINEDTRPLWEDNDHVPFYRILSKDAHGPFAGSRLGQIGKVIKHLKGGTGTLRNPLESIIVNIGTLIEASMKNRAMADVVQNFVGSGIITKAPQAETTTALVDLKQIENMFDEAGVSIDAVGRDMLQNIQQLYALRAPQGENIISVQENGKKMYYYVHDAGMMRGLAVDPNKWEMFMHVMRTPKRWITRSITLMPDFILKNWFRDMWHGYLLHRHGTIIPGYDSVKGWAHAIAEDKVFRDVMSGGGMFDAGYVNASDPNRTQLAMRRALLGAGRSNILDTPRKVMQFYMRISNGAENAGRIAIYQKTLQKTGSRKQALFESRDIMDFAVRGANPLIRFLTETVPFWGARVQGLARVGKGFTEHPVLTAMRGSAIALATIGLYVWNRDDDRYKELPDYEKRMYYHFFDVFKDGDHWRLPKPFEVGAVFGTIPEILTEAWLSDQPDKGAAAVKAIFYTIGEQLNLKPDIQFYMPVYEVLKNEDTFTQAPIVSKWEDEKDPKAQYSYNTSATVKAVAQAVPDWVPVDMLKSPKKLQHLLSGFFGPIMDYTLLASDMIYRDVMGEPPYPSLRADEIPFLKAFKRDTTPRYDKYLQTMYDVMEKADAYYNAAKQYEEEGLDEKAEAYREKHADYLEAREEMGPAKKEVGEINKEIREIYADPDMTPEQKRKEIDELLEERSKVAEGVYDYRPGGKENSQSKKPQDDVLNRIIGMNKKDQVDTLIAAGLPHTAILVNDVRISNKKLQGVA